MHRAHSFDPWTSDDKKLSIANMWKPKSNNKTLPTIMPPMEGQ